MSEQRQEVLQDLQDVKYVGPALAERLYEEISIRTVEDIVEAADKGWLQKLDGIGQARERDILASAREIHDGPSEGSSADRNGTERTGAGDVSVKQVDRSAPDPDDTKEPTPAPEPSSEPRDLDAPGAADASEAGEESATEPEPGDDRSFPRPRIERFIDRLRCPACGHDTFDRDDESLTCTACRRTYEIKMGIADLAAPGGSGGGLLNRIMQSRLYSRVYESASRPWFTKAVSERSVQGEIELAAEMLELGPSSVVLDVACGTANFTRHFAEEIGASTAGYDDQSLVVGMDLSWPMLERARGYLRRDGLNDRIFLVRGDATRMPVGRATFNRIHCAGALHMMDDIDEALRNFARALEPDGICVIGTFLARGHLVSRLAKRVAEAPTGMHWFERDELHERLDRAGLAVVEDDISDQAITVKARRK